ncbi:hypothetical protein ACWGJT_12345 [Streptomyces xantholiticus]
MAPVDDGTQPAAHLGEMVLVVREEGDDAATGRLALDITSGSGRARRES